MHPRTSIYNHAVHNAQIASFNYQYSKSILVNPHAYLLWRGEFCFQYNPLTLHLWRGEAFNKNTSIYNHAVQNAQIASFNYQFSKRIHVNPHAYLLWRGEFCFQYNPLTLHLWRGEAFNKNTSIYNHAVQNAHITSLNDLIINQFFKIKIHNYNSDLVLAAYILIIVPAAIKNGS